MIQFSASAVIVLSTAPGNFGFLSFAVALIGFCLHVWAWCTFGVLRIPVMPEVKQDAVLVKHGPYRWIKHPMYVALVLFCGGFLLACPTLRKFGLWIALVAAVWCKAKIEERLLKQSFPEYGP